MSTTTSIDTTLVSTTQQAPLGRKFTEHLTSSTGNLRGEREWVYVFNDEAATAFAQGDVIIRDPSATTYTMYGGLIAPVTNAEKNTRILGVANHAIAAGSFGWIICRGFALVKCGTGNISADHDIVTGGSAAGTAKDATLATDDACVFGTSLEAEATDSTTFDAYVNCGGA